MHHWWIFGLYSISNVYKFYHITFVRSGEEVYWNKTSPGSEPWVLLRCIYTENVLLQVSNVLQYWTTLYRNDRRQVIDVNSVKIAFKQLIITSTDKTDCVKTTVFCVWDLAESLVITLVKSTACCLVWQWKNFDKKLSYRWQIVISIT